MKTDIILMMKSSRDQSHDIKGALLQGPYLLNYMLDWVETQHVFQKRSVSDENWHHMIMMTSSDKSRDIKGPLFK